MATAAKIGREETAHGTLSASLVSVPCAFNPKLRQMNKILDEDRQGQDRNFSMQEGHTFEEWEVGETGIYHDSFGYFLMSAIGLPTKAVSAGETVVWDHTFKFVDDPESLSFQFTQPRRATQSYQCLNGVVDELEVAFEAEGDLVFTASGFAEAETEISAITHSFTSTRPFAAWAGTVLVGGGAFADLVSGKVKISRNRNPFFTINNTQQPGKMSIGARVVEFELVCDFVTKTEYDKYKAASTQALQIDWTDAGTTLGVGTNPAFGIQMGTTAYESGEVDTDPDLPLVTLAGKALYDTSDASLAVFTLTSDVDYTA